GRSCHALPPAPVPILRTRSRPAFSLPPCWAPHNSPLTERVCARAPAALAGPPCRWVSAATQPAVRRTRAPCTPAASLAGSSVTPPRSLPPPRRSLHRPPTASAQVHLRAPPPRSAALPHAAPALLRSR